jgi:hypothetical protein
VIASRVVKTCVWLVALAVSGSVTAGCKSEEAVICERLDDCHLLPSAPPASTTHEGLSEKDCEVQVRSELDDSNRDKCSDCVSSHSCDTLQDACRAVCNPPY